MSFREVRVYEVEEMLRLWLGKTGLRSIERLAGIDRKTVHRYVEAAVASGLDRHGGEDQLNDGLLALVVEKVRPHRTDGHGAALAKPRAAHRADPGLARGRRAHGGEGPQPPSPPRRGGADSDPRTLLCEALRASPGQRDHRQGGRRRARRGAAGRLRSHGAALRLGHRAPSGLPRPHPHRLSEPASVNTLVGPISCWSKGSRRRRPRRVVSILPGRSKIVRFVRRNPPKRTTMANQNVTPTITIERTDIRVLPLGVGTMTWGRKTVMTAYGGTRSPQNEEEAFRASLDAGVILFDTAEMYSSGRSERRLGELASESDAIVATKYAPSPSISAVPSSPGTASGQSIGGESGAARLLARGPLPDPLSGPSRFDRRPHGPACPRRR